MSESWPWLTYAGLGAFHGLNPAMGWLFAVALGLHRQSRTAMIASLVPVAIGHAISIAFVAGLLVLAGALVPHHVVRAGAGALLLAWATYHWRFGHRHRIRLGMQVGLGGLAVWSFLMATAHGAGLMLWPALMQTCLDGASTGTGVQSPLAAVLVGVGVHTAAMLGIMLLVAILVHEALGVAILRTAWLNVDMVWAATLGLTGTLLLLDVL